VRSQLERSRPWLALLGLVLTAALLLPPVATLARQYVFAEVVQFAGLAVVVPALVVLGAPWRLTQAWGRLADRIAAARSHQPGGARAWLVLTGYIAVALAWRVPAAVDALARTPVLTLAEAVTVIPAGCALWLELVESPPFLPRISRPQRAAFAALPMWALWAAAYILGFSQSTWFTAITHPGHGLGTIADQEIGAGLLWATPALCFVPVVYVALITWLRDSASPDDELRELTGAVQGSSLPMPRPPRGWR
jgi:cytochrome c oxidase assembly factor CtaG